MAKRKSTKEQTTIYKALPTKLKIDHEQHEPHNKPGAPDGLAVPAPYVTPVVLLLN